MLFGLVVSICHSESFHFQLAVDVLDTPFDLCVTCPVIIGSIPLRSIVQQYMPNYQPPPVTVQPVAFGGPVQSDIRKYELTCPRVAD